jgi:hypothetical protein
VKSKVLTALPAFFATFGGIGIYVAFQDGNGFWAAVVLVCMVVVGTLSLRIGQKQIPSRTVLGTVLISGWILGLISFGATLTALFFWVGLQLPEWISTGKVTDETKELSKVLLGAATAFVAVVFTDDLDKAEGELWPSTKTKDAFKGAFEGRFKSGSPSYDSAFEERVRPRPQNAVPKINGWGFVARYQRATTIMHHKDADRRPTNPDTSTTSE